MYLHRGAYRFVPKEGKPVPLSADLAEALTKYAALIGNQWPGRTLGDVIDRYRVEVLPLKRAATTRKDQGTQLGKLKKVFGDMLPDSVTTQHCYQYKDTRRDKDGNAAPSAADHEVKLLGHVFAKAIRWGKATVNPVRAMEREQRQRKPKRYVTDVELDAALDVASERMRCAIDLDSLTGLSEIDLLDLTRAHLKADGIEIARSKTGNAILIEYTPALDEVIERCKRLAPQVSRGNHLIRTRSGKRYSRGGFRSNWKRLMLKAVAKHGIQPFAFKLIRKKHATDMAEKYGIRAAQDALAHSSEETTRKFYIAKPVKVRPLR